MNSRKRAKGHDPHSRIVSQQTLYLAARRPSTNGSNMVMISLNYIPDSPQSGESNEELPTSQASVNTERN